MQARPMRAAPSRHLEDLNYLIAHVKADPQAAEIVPGLEAATAALKARIAEWDRRRYAVEEAQAGLMNLDEAMRNAVRFAQAVVLDDLGRNRRSVRFVTWFPHGLGPFLRSSYQDLLAAARSLTRQFAQDPSPRIQEQAALLQAAVDALEAAFARRSQALADEGAAYGQLQLQKLQTTGACRWASAQLTALYPEQADRVRSYFRTTVRRARRTAPESEESAFAESPSAEPTFPDEAWWRRVAQAHHQGSPQLPAESRTNPTSPPSRYVSMECSGDELEGAGQARRTSSGVGGAS